MSRRRRQRSKQPGYRRQHDGTIEVLDLCGPTDDPYTPVKRTGPDAGHLDTGARADTDTSPPTPSWPARRVEPEYRPRIGDPDKPPTE